MYPFAHTHAKCVHARARARTRTHTHTHTHAHTDRHTHTHQRSHELLRSDDAGRVKALVLSREALFGTLPPAAVLGQLPRLELLLASDTGLSGTLPDDWGAGLPMLGGLDVSKNELTGTIPASWQKLELKLLDAS